MENTRLKPEKTNDPQDRRFVPESQFQEWADSTRGFKKDLEVLTASAEKEFLSIGDSLRDFRIRAIEITKTSSSVVEIVSGSDFTEGISRLRVMRDHIKNYMEHSTAELQTVEGYLKKILNIHENVYSTLEHFTRIVKGLRMLSLHIKILSAEIDHVDSDFNTLAADISSLAGVIEKKSKDILEQTRASDLSVRETISKIATLRGGLDQLAFLIMQAVGTTITSLSEKYNISSVTAKALSNGSNEMSQGIGKILELLQIQDITRQQLEAVKTDLSRVGSKLGDTMNPGTAEVMELVKVCGHQSANLRHVRDELSQAVAGIGNNLRMIAKSISQIMTETRKLAGTSNKDETSFFTDMETGIIKVLSSISETFFECSKTNHELLETVNRVVNMVGGISGFIKDIENIGMEMELLSLNARIKAAHTGERGAGLAVLAEAVQQLSTDVCEKTILLSSTFKEVTNIANNLSGAIHTDRDEKDSKIEDILIEMEQLLTNLRKNNADIMASLGSIGEECLRLGNDIEETVLRMKLGQVVHSMDNNILKLDSIRRQAAVFLPEEMEIEETLVSESKETTGVELF